jgi:hypothetical protein
VCIIVLSRYARFLDLLSICVGAQSLGASQKRDMFGELSSSAPELSLYNLGFINANSMFTGGVCNLGTSRNCEKDIPSGCARRRAGK